MSSSQSLNRATFGAMTHNGDLSEKMIERMKKGSQMPGWTKRNEFNWYDTLLNPEG